MLFATNRLFRKVYRTLEFAEEVVNEYAIRAVFVKSGVDSANKDQWKMLLHFRAIMDEFQVSVSAEHIRAALEGLFLEGYVYGTLTFGYRGEPVPGKLTKRKKTSLPNRTRSRREEGCRLDLRVVGEGSSIANRDRAKA